MSRASWLVLLLAGAPSCDAPAPRDKDQWPIDQRELASKPEPGDAEKIYARTCIACHGYHQSATLKMGKL